MKFIKLLIVFSIFFGCQHRVDVSRINPEFRLINKFAKKLKQEKGLVLHAYGINHSLEKDYQFVNGTANLYSAYYSFRNKDDGVSKEEARCLLISVTESFVNAINTDEELRPRLDVYPVDYQNIQLRINFVDKNKVELGQGVSYVGLRKGKIKYEGYKIEEYNAEHIWGRHFTIHEETYPEALKIAEREGCIEKL